MLADTGAGSSQSIFDLILDEEDCVLCGGIPGAAVSLGGAYVGAFPLYDVPVSVPSLGFAKNLRVHCSVDVRNALAEGSIDRDAVAYTSTTPFILTV